jgi:SAM-dependent methyltransferase
MHDDALTPERNALYKAQFDSLSENTTEYRDMRQFFEDKIFPDLPALSHFLDIGAGRGNYARPFSLLFEQTTIVEPNEVFVNDTLDWAKEAGSNLRAFNASWQDLVWQGGETDLVLMSHMLYYVPKMQRLTFIRKAYETLKRGGLLLIVLNSDICGIRDVYKAFYTKDLLDEMPFGEEIAALLRAEGYPNVEERIFPAVITLPSREEAAQLIDFLLLRRVPFNDEESIAKREAFIDANLLHDSKYQMDSQGTIVILRKD